MLRRWGCVLVLAALGLAACDSGGDEPAPAELIVGSWVLVGVSDARGDQTPTFQQNFNSVQATFDADGTYRLVVDLVEGDDLTLSGPYALSEAQGTLTLTVEFGGAPTPVPFGFTFRGEDTLEVRGASNVLNLVLNTTLEGEVVLTLSRA
ncbi:DUF5004 domain-containing protein [Rhodocaloribacter litoris]|uniref:DUF5004 domain-containing protein n=1 Tax=Rhodocaloribacter litoris TaxID=2558931 RepID=UPI0014225354|nr:DUF5004 domain-containing protein [Rhodocaloribacter litoris]QXD16732.1 DUF5004 domain-containing protein [Rhodocaloribacter litoris]